MSIYDIKVEDYENNEVSMEAFKGKVLLIVNTATHCGFTPQYTELQNLYEKYKDQGFVVLDFPTNQFANQTPENSKEINEFCTIKYNTTFFRANKIDVNGKDESILYTFLKYHKKGLMGRDIKWNFTKFLVDRKGSVIKRYWPSTKPSRIARDIEALLKD